MLLTKINYDNLVAKKNPYQGIGVSASPRGEGVSPPRPARKNDQSRGVVAGQNKSHILKFSQKRKLIMEHYCNTE